MPRERDEAAGRCAAFAASPENSRTSTLCLLVDTVTGTEGEPGVGGEREGEGEWVGDKKKKKKERGESSSERNIACHPLGGKVN